MDTRAIIEVADALEREGSNISRIASCYKADGPMVPQLVNIYREMLLDSLRHVQMLTLELTRQLTETEQAKAANGDDSVFAAGELDHKQAGGDEGEGDDG